MNDYFIEIIKRKLHKDVADNLLEYIKDLEDKSKSVLNIKKDSWSIKK